MSSAVLLLKTDGDIVCAGVLFGVESGGQGCCGIGVICPSSCIELYVRGGGDVRDLHVHTLQPHLAVGVASGCMRVDASAMLAVNSAIGLCCLGIERSSALLFCGGALDVAVSISSTRGQTHAPILSGGSGAVALDCYTCEGARLFQRFACVVDNMTMRVRCARPLLLAGACLTSRREVQALLLPAEVPEMLPESGGWECGKALPICLAVAWMERELEMTVDSINVSRHEHVPEDFLQAMIHSLAMKPDCVFALRAKALQESPMTHLSTGAFACATLLTALIQHDASSENSIIPESKCESMNTCRLLFSLMLRCAMSCRLGQQIWVAPDSSTLNALSSSYPYKRTAKFSWTSGYKATAGAALAVLVNLRRCCNSNYPIVQNAIKCNWNHDDLRAISSYEAANLTPLSFESIDISAVAASLIQFCGHSISAWQQQTNVDFNESMMLLQFLCCSCRPDLITCTGMLQHLLDFTLKLLRSRANGIASGGAQVGTEQKHNTLDFEVGGERCESLQLSALESGIGICCNAIEVIHYRLGTLACRISRSFDMQIQFLSHTCSLLEDLMASPLKSNIPLVPFARQFFAIIKNGQDDSSLKHILAACGHSFALLAASANASRGNFARSCLLAGFLRLFLNTIDQFAQESQQENISQPIINQISIVVAEGLAAIISSTLTSVLKCRLESDVEMRNCLYKCIRIVRFICDSRNHTCFQRFFQTRRFALSLAETGMVQRLLKVLSTYIGSRECATIAARCTECISDMVILNEGTAGDSSVDIVTVVSMSMNSMMQSRDACVLALSGLKGLIRSFSLIECSSLRQPLSVPSSCKSALTAHLFSWSKKMHVSVIESAVNAGTVDMLLGSIKLNSCDVGILASAADCLSWMMVGHETTNLQEFLALNANQIVDLGVSALRTCLIASNSSRCARAWCRFFTSMLTNGGVRVPGQARNMEVKDIGFSAKLAKNCAHAIIASEGGISLLQALPTRFGHDPKVLRCIIQFQSALAIELLRNRCNDLYPTCSTGDIWKESPRVPGKVDQQLHGVDPIACEFINFVQDKLVRSEDESVIEWVDNCDNGTFDFGSINSVMDTCASMMAVCASAGQYKPVSRALSLLCLWLGGIAELCRRLRIRVPLQVQVVRKLGSSIRDLCRSLCSNSAARGLDSSESFSFGRRAAALAIFTSLFSASIPPDNCATADVSANVSWQHEQDAASQTERLWSQLFMGEGGDATSATAADVALEPTERELLLAGTCALVRQLALLGPAARLALGVSSTIESICGAVCALDRSVYALFSQSQALRTLLMPTGKQTAQIHLNMDVFLPIPGAGACQTSLFLYIVSMLVRSRSDAAAFGSTLSTLGQALYCAQRCFVRVKMAYTSSTLARGLQLPFGNGPNSRALLKLSPKLPVRGGVLLSPTTAPATIKIAAAFPSKPKAPTSIEIKPSAVAMPTGATGVVALLTASRERREFERKMVNELRQQRGEGAENGSAINKMEDQDREAAAAAAQKILQEAAAAEAAALRAEEAKKGLPQNVLRAIAMTSKMLLTPNSIHGFDRGGVDECATDFVWDGLASLPWRAHLVASLARDAGDSGDAVFSIGNQVAAFADGDAVSYMTMYMHKLRCWLDHTTNCTWPCCCCANQLQQLYNLLHSIHSVIDCASACNASDERAILDHYSDLVSMSCQLLASKQVLGSQQTVHALLVLMTSLADARLIGIRAKKKVFKSSILIRVLSPPVFPYRRMFTLGGVQQSLFEGVDRFGSDSDTGSRMLWLISKLYPVHGMFDKFV